jgi:hypothetical protein
MRSLTDCGSIVVLFALFGRVVAIVVTHLSDYA